jgi:hypothetical protein
VREQLPQYAEARNDPDNATSHLSPYPPSASSRHLPSRTPC